MFVIVLLALPSILSAKGNAICTLASAPNPTASETQVCRGDTILIEVDPQATLGDETSWGLFTDACNGQLLDSNNLGAFIVQVTRSRTYFVRGIGCSELSPCDSIEVFASYPVFGEDVIHETSAGTNDGVITISSVSGGLAPYQYSIDNGENFQASAVFKGLVPRSYDVRVRDSLNCQSINTTVRSLYWTSPNVFLQNIRTDSTYAWRDSLFSNQPFYLQVDYRNGLLFWSQYNDLGDKDLVVSSNLDGSNKFTHYSHNQLISDMALDKVGRRWYISDYSGQVISGSYDGDQIDTIIDAQDGLGYNRIAYDHQRGLIFLARIHSFTIVDQNNNQNPTTDISLDIGNRVIRDLIYDQTNARVYLLTSTNQIFCYDLLSSQTTILGPLQIGFSPRKLVYDQTDNSFYYNSFNEINKYNVDTDQYRLFQETGDFVTSMSLGDIAQYRVCPAQAQVPMLSIQSSTPLCFRDTAIISVINAGSLGASAYWTLYEGRCGGNPLDTSRSGVFRVIPEQKSTYYVRGEDSNCFGPCSSVTIGDSIVPSITCTNDTLYISAGMEYLDLLDIVPESSIDIDSSLEDVLVNFMTYSDIINNSISNPYEFEMDLGESGTFEINEGGNELYDGGNILNTNLGDSLLYTDGQILNEVAFGPDGKYFTKYENGIFILVAEKMSIDSFYITGNLGADGLGESKQFSLSTSCNGKTYYGYFKGVSDNVSFESAGDPTVNHLIIVENNNGVTQTVSENTNSDLHTMSGLQGNDRLLYMLFSTKNTFNLSDVAINQIFQSTISALLCGVNIPDNCGEARVFTSKNNVSCADVGQSQQVVFARDLMKNEDSCTFQLTVSDTIMPLLTCPMDTTIVVDATSCGAQVFYGTQPTIVQKWWAKAVIQFSTEYADFDYAAIQATGEPDVYPDYGDFEMAWATSEPNDQREFIELLYDEAVRCNGVEIYETNYPGAIDSVYLRNAATSKWNLIWSGTAAPMGDTSRIFKLDFPFLNYEVDAIRLALNCPAVDGYNEIDAVALINSSTFLQDVSVVDNCASNIDVVQTAGFPSGAFFPIGVITNRFTATDGGGYSDSCSFTVTIKNPDNSCCRNDILLKDEYIYPGHYKTSGKIMASGLLLDGLNITLQAEKDIHLDPNLNIQAGGIIEANIQVCEEPFPDD